MREAWNSLENFSSYEIVKSFYKNKHGLSLSTRHAREISAPFTHAKSYFSAAKDADQTVKPLLLYYGCVSLARGLNLYLRRSKRECTLSPSHGISTLAWNEELSKENPDFTRLKIRFNASGTLSELNQATKSLNLLRVGSSGITIEISCTNEFADLEISLGDLLARNPRLQKKYYFWNKDCLCLQSEIEYIDDNQNLRFKFPLRNELNFRTQDIADAIMNETPFVFEKASDTQIFYRGPNNKLMIPVLRDKINEEFLGIGDLWISARYRDGNSINKISELLALSYILGMLVRYHPMQWTALLGSQIVDSGRPMLSAAVELIESEFPRLVVDHLERKFD